MSVWKHTVVESVWYYELGDGVMLHFLLFGGQNLEFSKMFMHFAYACLYTLRWIATAIVWESLKVLAGTNFCNVFLNNVAKSF